MQADDEVQSGEEIALPNDEEISGTEEEPEPEPEKPVKSKAPAKKATTSKAKAAKTDEEKDEEKPKAKRAPAKAKAATTTKGKGRGKKVEVQEDEGEEIELPKDEDISGTEEENEVSAQLDPVSYFLVFFLWIDRLLLSPEPGSPDVPNPLASTIITSLGIVTLSP